MSTIKISEEYKDLIEEAAGQLGVSRKEVIDMILEWFFSQKAGNLEEEEEEEEEEEDS